MNASLFQIGVFPWVMIFLTTIFFAPDWPRRMLPSFFKPEPAETMMRRRAINTGHGWGSPVLHGFVIAFVMSADPVAVSALSPSQKTPIGRNEIIIFPGT